MHFYKLSLSLTIIFDVGLYELEALLLVSLNNNDSSIFASWSFLYLLFNKLENRMKLRSAKKDRP